LFASAVSGPMRAHPPEDPAASGPTTRPPTEPVQCRGSACSSGRISAAASRAAARHHSPAGGQCPAGTPGPLPAVVDHWHRHVLPAGQGPVNYSRALRRPPGQSGPSPRGVGNETDFQKKCQGPVRSVLRLLRLQRRLNRPRLEPEAPVGHPPITVFALEALCPPLCPLSGGTRAVVRHFPTCTQALQKLQDRHPLPTFKFSNFHWHEFTRASRGTMDAPL
jgi:hypothetical protein